MQTTKYTGSRDMTSQSYDQEFFFKLREEMNNAMHRRFQLQLAKITSLGTLIGAGTILIKNTSLSVFFYVIPFVAVCFDLLITSESFTIRRLSSFIFKEKESIKDIEFRWEQYVRDNPGKFAAIASNLFTLIIAVGCAVILIMSAKSSSAWLKSLANITWMIFLVAFLTLNRYVDRQPGRKKWKYSCPEKSKRADT